jgi:hypothetical protein
VAVILTVSTTCGVSTTAEATACFGAGGINDIVNR